jgi:CRP/FNR family transcriptional regulator, cyclic AMP receptor protein
MYLETAYLFQGVSEETRGKILEAGKEESHAPGAFIFRKGEPANNFFILSEGRVRLSVGHGELLAYVASDAGDALGWSSLVENQTYTASAECLVPVKVLKIENQRLDQILRNDCASGLAFYKHLAALIGRRLTKSHQAALSLHGEREPQPGG